MTRLYTLNSFIAPDFSLVVPNWTFGAAADDYCAASHSYRGPVYVLLTPYDAAVLINISPERERDAVALVCRVPHEGRINHAPEGTLREADAREAASARSRIATEAGSEVPEIKGSPWIWICQDTGLCIHGEPHLISLFRFQDGRCTDVVSTSERHRIAPIGEE